MGWSSIKYSEAPNNISLSKHQILNFVKDQFGLNIVDWHVHSSVNDNDNHEFYGLFQTSTGKPFIAVVLVRIEAGELEWLIVEEDEGPIHYNCDPKLFKKVISKTQYATRWRNKCIEQWKD